MDPHFEQLESQLRAGRPDEALKTAGRACEVLGSTRETGIEIAKVSASVYRDLIAQPVHDFADGAPAALPSEVGPLVQKALQRLIRMTEDYEKKLWEVHTERLVRELRDWTRARHMDAATSNVARLMALVDEDKRAKRADYIGSVLGTIVNNQAEVQRLLAALEKDAPVYYLTPALVQGMKNTCAKRHSELSSMNMDNIEREFTSTFTSVVVDIQNVLPDSTKMSDPDENTLRDVGDIFRSILRVPIWRQEADLLMDATNIFVEFVPKEQSATAKMARVEGRLYGSLGVTAKKAVQLSFMEIGKNKFFTDLYNAWARDHIGTESVRHIVEFMGALRSTAFNDFLRTIKEDRKAAPAMSAHVGAALGSIAGEEAADELLVELRTVLAKKRLETRDLEVAEALVSNIGKIVKSPRTQATERHKIHEYLRSHVPEDLTKLATHTALEAFTIKVDEQSPTQRQWAIRVLCKGLWLADQTTVHHKGGERQESELGFRGPIVEALVKVAAKEVPSLLRALESLSGRYSGAYIAVAELLDKIGDPAGVQLLERILVNTLLFDEASSNVYQAEFYWDAGSQTRKPLTKDKVLAPIVYAIGKMGTDKSKEVLKRYRDNIASGKFPPPTAEIAGYIERFLGGAAFETTSDDGGGAVVFHLAPGELKDLLKALTAGYWLTGKDKRRMKKIAALSRLASATPEEAMDTVFDQLADKDSLVVSAAISCMSEYAAINKPKTMRDLAINGTLDRLNHKDPAMRQGAVKLLKEIGPNRKDVKEKITGFLKTVDRRETKLALAEALKSGSGSPGSDTLGALAEAEGGHDPKKGPAPPTKTEMLEAKNAYFKAREAWVRGGKRGDPPAKPPGME